MMNLFVCCLLFFTKVISIQCNEYSISNTFSWTFMEERILCHTIPHERSFCNMYEKPNEINCIKKNNKTTYNLEQDGVLSNWICASDSSYQFYIFCPPETNFCLDTMEKCYAIYNASVLVYDSLSTILTGFLLLFVILFIGSVIYTTKFTLSLYAKKD